MRLILLLSFILSLSGCANVVIQDSTWCADAGAYGARCTTTESNQHFSLNKYQWDKLRAGQICTADKQPGMGYKNIKVSLEKLCADSNLCTQGQRADLSSISKEVDGLLDSTKGSPAFNSPGPKP